MALAYYDREGALHIETMKPSAADRKRTFFDLKATVLLVAVLVTSLAV